MKIERATDAMFANSIINHPDVYPWIKGSQTGFIDISKVIENKNNVVLVGEYGCVIFYKWQTGIYEFHTCVLPKGRGVWMQEGAAAVFHWMFTKTDAFELMTKCPLNNLASRSGARSVGCTLQFTTKDVWPTENGAVPVDVYSLLLQHWVVKAPNLEEQGHWFHENLIAKYEKDGINIKVEADDKTHDRYVGAALEMIRGGQIVKAVSFYNRWAVMAGYKPISIVSKDPLVLDIVEAKIRITDDNFEVI